MAGLARIWLALAGLVAGALGSAVSPAFAGTVALTGAGAVFRRRGPWRGLGLFALAFALGVANASLRSVERQPVARLAESVPSCDVQGRTLEEAGGLGVLAAVDRIVCGDTMTADAGAVFLDDLPIPPGRAFTATGWLIPLAHEEFDLARRRAGAGAALDVVSGDDAGPVGGLSALAGRVRDGLSRAAAPLGTPGQLLRGLTIGDTSGIDEATEEAMRRSGLSHLLAVSGSNVAILLAAVALLVGRASPRTRVACCAVSLVAFVAVVGPDASVLRAGGMGAVALLALGAGRRAEPLHALGLALLGVVAVRPGIAYSAGLHLSAAATAGIVLWAEPVAARLSRWPRPAALAAGATVAAQAAVTPVLVGTFGQVSLAALPANLLALPAVAPATVLGLAAGAVGAWSDAPAALLARLAAPFAGWVLRVGEAFGEPSWASVPVPRGWGAILAVPVAVAALLSLPRKLSPPARNLVAEPPSEGSRRP